MADRDKGHRSGGILRGLLVLAVAALLLAVVLLFTPWQRHIPIDRFWAGGRQAQMEGGLLVFPGALGATALGLTGEERAKVLRFLQENGPGVKHVEVWVSPQDSYGALRPDSQLSLNLVVFMEDGTLLKSPTVPLTRKELGDKLVRRLRRDLDAYNAAAVKGGVGKDVVITTVP